MFYAWRELPGQFSRAPYKQRYYEFPNSTNTRRIMQLCSLDYATRSATHFLEPRGSSFQDPT